MSPGLGTLLADHPGFVECWHWPFQWSAGSRRPGRWSGLAFVEPATPQGYVDPENARSARRLTKRRELNLPTACPWRGWRWRLISYYVVLWFVASAYCIWESWLRPVTRIISNSNHPLRLTAGALLNGVYLSISNGRFVIPLVMLPSPGKECWSSSPFTHFFWLEGLVSINLLCFVQPLEKSWCPV